MDTQESYLRCTSCDEVAGHVVVYAGRLVTQVKCTNCGAVTTLDISAEYIPDLKQRIQSKPRRMARRLRKDPTELAISLPGRTASKPARLLREFRRAWESRRKR